MNVITAIWQRLPGQYFFLCTKSASKKWREHVFNRATMVKRVDEFLRENMDKDVYFCPHGFSERYRKEEFAELPNLLWADLDEADPHNCAIKPTIAIESSPGRYVGLWVLDKPMTKDINRRLTYFLGADRGGWDLTQVLRFPGTLNYKYASTPRVRLLWDDGPRHKLRDIVAKLPEVKGTKGERVTDDGHGDTRTINEILREYHLPGWVKTELMSTPTPGKRSEVLWKLEQALKEGGVTRADAFSLIRQSTWNKFKGRTNEVGQLNRELDKVYSDQHGPEDYEERKRKRDGKVAKGYNMLRTPMSEVEDGNTDWLWYPNFARGEVTLVEGDPGVGKSYLVQMVAKAFVDGEKLPVHNPARARRVKGKVAYFDVENTAGTVTKKRLRNNDCKNMGDFYQEEEPFTIDSPESVKDMFDALERLKPCMVVFDTINLYIGKADTSKSSEVTQALAMFKEMAKRFNCSVVLLRHLTKSTAAQKAIYRGQGSIAFSGIARIQLTIGLHPQDPSTRVMAMTKANLAPFGPSLCYTISSLPDTLKEGDRSRFAWGDFVDLRSEDILMSPDTSEHGEKTEDAAKLLREVLGDGEVLLDEVMRMAESRSISKRTMQRAKDEVGAETVTRGQGRDKKTYWMIPTKH